MTKKAALVRLYGTARLGDGALADGGCNRPQIPCSDHFTGGNWQKQGGE
jgi:hypothetical protein